MTEDEKMQVAVFRFSVISDFLHSPSMRCRKTLCYYQNLGASKIPG
jgi:hypothetical protein